jgi:hypothetical protein
MCNPQGSPVPQLHLRLRLQLQFTVRLRFTLAATTNCMWTVAKVFHLDHCILSYYLVCCVTFSRQYPNGFNLKILKIN